MNRNSAKLLTAVGIVCFLTTMILLVFNLVQVTNVPVFLLPALFVGGIMLIILSLAYYTERER